MASIAVMVLIETNDPELINASVGTARDTAKLRRAAIRNLPKLTRVVMVLPEEGARLMCLAHDIASSQAGIEVNRPPRDYVPPTNE